MVALSSRPGTDRRTTRARAATGVARRSRSRGRKACGLEALTSRASRPRMSALAISLAQDFDCGSVAIERSCQNVRSRSSEQPNDVLSEPRPSARW
jgi:hypothetical protein